MNKGIANYLKSKLDGLPYFDILGGLVQVIEKTDSSGGSFNTFRFPASTDVSGSDGSKLIDLIPNSAKAGLVYFEDGGAKPGNPMQSRGMYNFESSIRMVAWLNLKKITHLEQFYATPAIITDVITHLTAGKMENAKPYTAINVKVDRIINGDKGLFSKYSYKEDVNQFLMPPYDAFGLDLTITYRIHPDCFNLSLNQNI